jgi:hypothetical protein
MKLEKADEMAEVLFNQAAADGDRVLMIYFSREEDKYRATGHLDAGDALIVIGQLIKTFNLSAEAIAQMGGTQ